MMLRLKSDPWHKLRIRFESFAVIVLSADTESGQPRCQFREVSRPDACTTERCGWLPELIYGRPRGPLLIDTQRLVPTIRLVLVPELDRGPILQRKTPS